MAREDELLVYGMEWTYTCQLDSELEISDRVIADEDAARISSFHASEMESE